MGLRRDLELGDKAEVDAFLGYADLNFRASDHLSVFATGEYGQKSGQEHYSAHGGLRLKW